MRRAQTAEAPALHGASKALALCMPGDIDQLTRLKVRGRDRRADFGASIVSNAEFGDARLERDFCLQGIAHAAAC